jgi:hypothetical protein
MGKIVSKPILILTLELRTLFDISLECRDMTCHVLDSGFY